MKDILTHDITQFRIDVYTMTVSQLKQLLQGLHAYTNENFHNYKGAEDPRHEMVLDLERKKTIIMKELQRRKVLTNKTTEDYHNWLYGGNKKRLY